MGKGRVCNRCKESKPWEDFSINSKGLNGRKSICKVCSNTQQKAHQKKKREEDPEGHYNYRREKLLVSKYGITSEDFQRMLDTQGGGCAICGVVRNRVGNNLFVDHCHTGGHNRGLLCYHCNTMLGMAFDDPDILRKAIDYLGSNGNG